MVPPKKGDSFLESLMPSAPEPKPSGLGSKLSGDVKASSKGFDMEIKRDSGGFISKIEVRPVGETAEEGASND